MIQLKVKTEYTFGQTFAPLKKVIQTLKAQGCTAAGIVDTNSTWGHVNFHKACVAEGIKPLLGIEIAVTDDDTNVKMWFLARNVSGLRELYASVSNAHLQGLQTKAGKVPRFYREDIRRMSADILKFAGEITDPDFLAEIGAVVDLSPASRVLNGAKRGIAEQRGLELVEVSDNAFCAPEDVKTFEMLARTGLKASKQYLLPELARQDASERVAASCELVALPSAPMIRAAGSLEDLCRQGIAARGMQDRWTPEYEERLQYELELIRSKDFESYFIIVADMVHYAKRHMLVGPSRGSAAGSLVCYISQITEIDPIPPKLYFERFIDVSRKDLPDIDLDFPDNKRHMVFEYMAEKYGRKNVANIGTLSLFKPKSALIQVCKALQIPPAATGAVKVAMIERSVADARASNCLEDTFKTTEPGKKFIADYPQAIYSTQIEGHVSHTGVHAAGLLVCNDEITNYCVVDADGIAHIEKQAAETLGLLKIDVLGLRTLGILEDANVGVDWYNLPFDDKETFKVFNDQRLCGIFQFEGEALRSISSQIKFESMVHIDAVTALARPGPFAGGVTLSYIRRMNGEKYEPIHPSVEEFMSETYGLPVYQEQTFAIVKNVGGFNWEETTFIRKGISKRMGAEFFAKFLPRFIEGAGKLGIPEKEAMATWEIINTMGSWQMNKAHTYSYAVISYWTAYLKAHFPLEFAAANLRSAKDEDSAVLLLREMVKEGVGFIAFDPQLSELNWSVKEGKLVGGFVSLNGIGESKALKLIEKRKKEGRLDEKTCAELAAKDSPFKDIFPMRSLYGHLYDAPQENGITGEIWHIDRIPRDPPLKHGTELVILGELIYKNLRDANEEVNIKKRGGKVQTGPTAYFDFRLRDDTDVIGGRISARDYARIGVELTEKVPLGSHLLIRAKFFNGIRYAFVQKWRWLNRPEEQAQ